LHQTAAPDASFNPAFRPGLLSQHNEAVGYSSGMRNAIDAWLGAADSARRTLSGTAVAGRSMPQPEPPGTLALTPADQRLSGALMRVNHVGEVCAQALYQAQALTARTTELAESMAAAARDEVDHLAWTEQRLAELGARPSVLNPLWYAGAFMIGLAAGRAGDRVSLGFVVETERQVEQHLASHLDRLPIDDGPSRAIVAQMRSDEARHAQSAQSAGGAQLPLPVRAVMRAAARVMTRTAHYI
jgi:ubiquinone biosynthesis monooxygenase Coq7